MIEYENIDINIPFKKWYIVYNTATKGLITDLSYNTSNSKAILLGNDVKLVEFDDQEEGKTYIESNSLSDENI